MVFSRLRKEDFTLVNSYVRRIFQEMIPQSSVATSDIRDYIICSHVWRNYFKFTPSSLTGFRKLLADFFIIQLYKFEKFLSFLWVHMLKYASHG